ncbi:hypothetical protein SeMB42_g02758 [Synchytrium endobioticum]|uniref:mitochondrial intermediate peptidase n=1 Tax=Synchytrium endobioticum TaxID=286115 RepID=A0A507DBU1_9FUNG|nr:hypothetical protein SeMB42_g02758 [Synchytrium endobioticum]
MVICRQCRLAAAIRPGRWPYGQRALSGNSLHQGRPLSFLSNLATLGHSSIKDHDEHLVQAFDHSPRQQHRQSYLFRYTKPITGLFGYTSLQHPNDLVEAARETLNQAQQVVHQVCCTSGDEHHLRRIVKRLDRLSDLICSVVDGAEVVKNLHPDTRWVAAAKEAHLVLCDYLNQLNTHTGLYKVLKKAVNSPSVVSHWDEQERHVAKLLLADFEKSGIHLSQIAREKVVDLHNRILSVGQDFVMGAGPGVPAVLFNDAYNDLAGVPKEIIESCLVSKKTHRLLHKQSNTGTYIARAIVPMGSPAVGAVLRFARNETARKRVFEASNSGANAQVALLEDLLKSRAELANVLGLLSYSSLHLSDKMAKTPETVINFLNELADTYRPQAETKLQQLRDIKQSHTASSTSNRIYAWDRFFYSQLSSDSLDTIDMTGLRDPFHPSHHTHSSSQHTMDSISAYLTPGLAFKGIAYLFRLLYGVRLHVLPVAPGETWHSDVVRLDVLSEVDGTLLGTIYCDLYEREVGGGRKTPLQRPEGTAVMDGKRYQIPVVVLITSFQRPSSNKPCLLSLGEVETLFHEMGHAVHSMLARTDYQHIAGTRCSVDFVEIPSMFHERFARHPVILSYFARHYVTGTPLPPAILQSIYNTSGYTNPLDGLSQVQAAALDQAFHSSEALSPSFDSTKVAKQVHDRYSWIPYVEGTRWHAQFSHLYSYGASYYAYFWSKRWVGRIHEKLFDVAGANGSGINSIVTEEDVKDVWRRSGDIFWKELLAPGGGRDPLLGLHKLGLDIEGDARRK